MILYDPNGENEVWWDPNNRGLAIHWVYKSRKVLLNVCNYEEAKNIVDSTPKIHGYKVFKATYYHES